MYETSPPSPGVAESFFDAHRSQPGPTLHRNLSEHGVATLDNLENRSAFAALAHSLVTLYAHPDADPDGLTALSPRPGSSEQGRLGFTDLELCPHTERSATLRPPHLMLLMCEQPAHRGGQSLLTDARAVAAELHRTAPRAWRELSRAGAAFFGGAAGHAGAVFEPAEKGWWTVRLRLDTLVRFSPRAEPHLPLLRQVLDRHTHALDLAAGQGVVLDNTRWLHGRRAFEGPRRMLRALGEPHPALDLSRGFGCPNP